MEGIHRAMGIGLELSNSSAIHGVVGRTEARKVVQSFVRSAVGGTVTRQDVALI